MKPEHRRVEVSSRRRALFPPDENSTDSDLGCISPLNFDDVNLENDKIFSLNKSVGDYDIIGLVDKSNSLSTPKSSTNNDLKSSSSPVVTPHHVTNISDESPTQQLKTPHDTSTNISLPKLTRKTDITSIASPLHNQDFDINKPKVRTALFPDMSLPSKTFYPATQTHLTSSQFIFVKNNSHIKPVKKKKLYLCNRQNKSNGQINAGVRHKIKKVKRFKKTKKMTALKVRMGDIMENSLINNISVNSKNINLNQETVVPDLLQNQPTFENRQPSPEPVLDQSKKFFKSSQRKGIVTVNKNIRLEVSNGRISLMDSRTNLKRSKEQGGTSSKKIKLNNDFDTNQNESFEETLISQAEISNVINSLEEKENIEDKQESVLMSPTSQMCNMTSGLALNSPKKTKNLNLILDTMSVSSSDKKELYPVFYPGKTCVPTKTDNSKSCNSAKKFKSISKDQMLLDAGQKRFGVTQCPECKIIYHMGDPGDEIMHLNYHNATHVFKFNGWKNERVVFSNATEGRIIQIVPTDSKIWWKKVKEVMEFINRDLGFYDMQFNTSNSQIFLYIKNKTIVGVLVAEAKNTAHKLLTTQQNEVDLCSEETYPIKCGVSRIWVSQFHRKKGIATTLMTSLKRNFIFGTVLTDNDIALSSPTEMGKIFGKHYFKTQNFLIYFV